MTTIQQLIIKAVDELGLSTEEPSVSLDTPELKALVAVAKRLIFSINRDRLYCQKSATVTLSNERFDLDQLPYVALTVKSVKISGKKCSFFVDGHILNVDNAHGQEVTIFYIGCQKELTSTSVDIMLPSFITDSLLVAGICYEYAKMKGLDYSISYYEETYKKGIESVFKTRNSVILPVRRFA